ncbi:hypothetical protein ACIBJC_37375 [Streptomyces sp. NPDC050509]|uniref:hypothetical protein n=1 Tax=Streptomyces sp. NPDC050509 TaxID=3365620 RepID=UPI0037A2CDA3
MKALLSSRPVLWFLFLFNLVVAVIAPFVLDGAQGVATAVGMAAVSLGARIGLLRDDARRRPAGAQRHPA